MMGMGGCSINNVEYKKKVVASAVTSMRIYVRTCTLVLFFILPSDRAPSGVGCLRFLFSTSTQPPSSSTKMM